MRTQSKDGDKKAVGSKSGEKSAGKAKKKEKKVSGKEKHSKEVESVRFMALKAFRKAAKEVKTGLTQKCVKHIAQLKKDVEADANKSDELNQELELLKSIKEINHIDIGDLICSKKIKPDDSSTKMETDEEEKSQTVSAKYLDKFLNHKKIVETSKLWGSKLAKLTEEDTERLEKRAEIKRSHDTARAAAASEFKSANLTRHVSTAERTKAVFVGSLQDQDKDFENARADKNLKLKPGDIEKTDLNMYKPAAQRTEKPDYARYVKTSGTKSSSGKKDYDSQAKKYEKMNQDTGDRRAKAESSKGVKKEPSFFAIESKPVPAKKVSTTTGDAVHPSWAAKQLAKTKNTVNIVKSQGTKITFD